MDFVDLIVVLLVIGALPAIISIILDLFDA